MERIEPVGDTAAHGCTRQYGDSLAMIFRSLPRNRLSDRANPMPIAPCLELVGGGNDQLCTAQQPTGCSDSR